MPVEAKTAYTERGHPFVPIARRPTASKGIGPGADGARDWPAAAVGSWSTTGGAALTLPKIIHINPRRYSKSFGQSIIFQIFRPGL